MFFFYIYKQHSYSQLYLCYRVLKINTSSLFVTEKPFQKDQMMLSLQLMLNLSLAMNKVFSCPRRKGRKKRWNPPNAFNPWKQQQVPVILL